MDKPNIRNLREDEHCNKCIMKKVNPQCLEGFVPFEEVFEVPFDVPDVILVGEGPGASEVIQGQPFIGDSRKLIRSILDESGYKYAICNVVCCRTDVNNRDPLPEERAHCSYYVKKYIEQMRSSVILLAGKHPAHTLLEDNFSYDYTKLTITTLQEKHPIIHQNGRKYLPIFHPAYFLHGGAPFSKEEYKDRVISRLRLAIEGSKYKHHFKIFDRSEMSTAFNLITEDLITLDYETIDLPLKHHHRLLGFGISDNKENIYIDFSSNGEQFPTDEEASIFLEFIKRKKTVVYNTSFETLATYRHFHEMIYYDDAYTMCKILQKVASLKENAQNLCEAPAWVDGVQTTSVTIQNYIDLIMSIKKLNDAQKRQLIMLDTHIVLTHIEDDTFYLDEIDWEAQKKKNRDKKLETVVGDANKLKEILAEHIEEYHQKLKRYCFDTETPQEWWGWACVPTKIMAEYCTLDCHWTLELRNVIWPKVKDQYQYYISQEFLGATMKAYGFHWNDKNAVRNEEYYKTESAKYLKLLVNLPQYKDKLKEKYLNKNFQMSMELRRQVIKWRKDNGLEKLPVERYKEPYPIIRDTVPDEFVLEVDNEWEKYNKSTDLLFESDNFEVLKNLFNPLSTTKENSSLFWSGIVTDRLEKAATLYYLRKELSDNEKCLDVLHVVNLDDYEEVIEWLFLNTKRSFSLMSRATKHATEMSSGLNDECFVEWYDILHTIMKVDIDDESTWIPEFYPIYYCRMFKKVQKSLSTYINGKCGRNRVYAIEPVNDIRDIPVRKQSYHKTPDKDSTFILDTDFAVCVAETKRWKSFVHTIPWASELREDFTTRTQESVMIHFDYCWSKDTRIKLLDSRIVTMEHLYYLFNNSHETLYTYSYDKSINSLNGLVHGTIDDVSPVKKVKTLIEITLDNGYKLQLTDNHKLFLSNGLKIEARNLKTGDSILSLHSTTYKSQKPSHKILEIRYIDYTDIVYNISIKEDHHNYFVIASDDNTEMILSSNSQSEVRIMAAMAGETSLLKVFKDPNADVHRYVASKIWKKAEENVTSTERRFAKNATFSLLYRKGVHAFARDFMKGDIIAAQKFFHDFFAAFPLIKAFIDHQDQLVDTTGIVYTMFGDPLRTDTGFEQDDGAKYRHGTNYPIQSLHYDTNVVLLDNTSVKIGEMAENPDKAYYGWAVDKRTKRSVPVQLEAPQKTGEKKEWIKVTLDNKMEFMTTTEHLWIMRDASEKRADQLEVGDSLMPFKTEPSLRKDIMGYDRYYNRIFHNDYTSELVYPIVAENFIGKRQRGYQCHHIDINSLNDTPNNLKYLKKGEHLRLHYANNAIIFLGLPESTTVPEALSAFMTWKNQNREELYPDWHNNQKEAVSSEVQKRQKETGSVLGISDAEERSRIHKEKVWGVHGDKIRKALKEGHNKPESKERHSKASKRLCQSTELRVTRCLTLAQLFNSRNIPWSHPFLWDIAIWRCLRAKALKFNTRYSCWFIEVMEWSEFISALEEKGCVSVSKTSEDDTYADIYVYIEHGTMHRKKSLRLYFELFMDFKINNWDEYVQYIGLKKKAPKDLKKLNQLLLKLRNNHKVVKVEKVVYDEPQPTYDISVPGYENFAIGAPDDGVFIHNSTSSVVCGHAAWKIYEKCKEMNLGLIPLCFTHDSIDAEVDIKFFPLIMDIIKGYAESIPLELGIPAKIDMEVGTCLNGMFEMKKISEVGYTYEIEGSANFLDEFINTLKTAFKVSYEQEKKETKVTSLSELFVARRAFSRYLGVEIPHIKGKLTLEPLT